MTELIENTFINMKGMNSKHILILIAFVATIKLIQWGALKVIERRGK